MKKFETKLKLFLLILIVSQACVPQAQFSEVEGERNKSKNERDELFSFLSVFDVRRTEISKKILKESMEMSSKSKEHTKHLKK